MLYNAVLGFGIAIIDNWPMLSGFVMPPLIAYLNKEVYREEEKYLVAIMATVTIAVIINFKAFTTALNGAPNDFAKFFLLVFFESVSTYHFYFKNSVFYRKIQGVSPNPATPGSA